MITTALFHVAYLLVSPLVDLLPTDHFSLSGIDLDPLAQVNYLVPIGPVFVAVLAVLALTPALLVTKIAALIYNALPGGGKI